MFTLIKATAVSTKPSPGRKINGCLGSSLGEPKRPLGVEVGCDAGHWLDSGVGKSAVCPASDINI